MDQPLFETKNYFLTEIDMENDPEQDSMFTRDLLYARLWKKGLVKPLSKQEMKKQYEDMEKILEKERGIHFAVRDKTNEKLIGFVRFAYIGWSNGSTWLQIGVGDVKHRGIAEIELFQFVLTYAFRELNLFRIEIDVPEFEPNLREIVKKAGFTEEVCNRDVLFFNGRYWNDYTYGILEPEWQRQN